MGLLDFFKPKKPDLPSTTVPPIEGPMPDATLLQKNTFVQPKESVNSDKTKINVYRGNPFRPTISVAQTIPQTASDPLQNGLETTPPLETKE